jgi:hypothetical protein
MATPKQLLNKYLLIKDFKMRLSLVTGLGLGLAAVLSACVTINIYFPAAAAEKAADKIIEEVWQLKDGQQAPAEKPAETPAGTPAK